MKKTANYQLPQWEQDDFIRMNDFNAMTQALDAALKSGADALSSEQTVRARAVSALTAALGTTGQNCRIACGTYTGTGKAGSANPNSLTFPFKPAIVFVRASSAAQMFANLYTTVLLRGCTHAMPVCGDMYKLTVQWGDKSVSWYTDETETDAWQNNLSGVTYVYAALGAPD